MATKTRILLVDDDPIVLNTLSHGLSKLDYQVETRDSGQAGLRSFTAEPPDIVVMDFNMPVMNGSETARQMLQTAYRPIIILSAYNDLGIVRDAIGCGISAYLVKPLEAEQLAPSIEAAMARFAEVNAILKQDANIQEAMEKNRVINAAVGIIMERSGLPNDVAFERLRGLARYQRRTLQDVAFELVDALSTINTIMQRLKT